MLPPSVLTHLMVADEKKERGKKKIFILKGKSCNMRKLYKGAQSCTLACNSHTNSALHVQLVYSYMYAQTVKSYAKSGNLFRTLCKQIYCHYSYRSRYCIINAFIVFDWSVYSAIFVYSVDITFS